LDEEEEETLELGDGGFSECLSESGFADVLEILSVGSDKEFLDGEEFDNFFLGEFDNVCLGEVCTVSFALVELVFVESEEYDDFVMLTLDLGLLNHFLESE